MDVKGRTAIVTGAGNGIGEAIGRELVARGARVVLVDLSERVQDVAAELGDDARAIVGDVAARSVIDEAIGLADSEFDSPTLYFANAGIGGAPGLEATDADWDLVLDVNVRAHVRAAQALVPRWLDAGEGYFVSTASAAGLLTQIGSATYSVTKHAAVAFAEWLSVTYGDRGVRVSCLCPMGVDTNILKEGEQSGNRLGVAATAAVRNAGEVFPTDKVATDVLAAVEAEQFLILPHEQVRTMWQQKTSDTDRWLAGMRRYQASLLA